MNLPLNVFRGGKLASRAGRMRLAAALGAATVVGVGTVAVASPARADDVDQDCATYHSWEVCVSYDFTTEVMAVNAVSTQNAGLHSLFLQIYGGGDYSRAYTFNAGQWHGFSESESALVLNPNGKTWGGIDSTRIVGTSF